MDATVLSRIQFALTSGFHYLYPPLSIGLGVLIVILEATYLRTKKAQDKEIVKFWVKVFALTFALGVATGIVQLFGFGTNWAKYSRFVGDVFGSALGAEGVFAFFLEAGFLGILLFGWDRVGPKMHFFAALMVCLGAHFSAIWIMVANSWMQTPAGYQIVGEGANAKAVVTDFWAMLFNPSTVDRLTHVILGCWLCGIFLMLSVSAYYLLKNKYADFTKKCLKLSLITGAVVLVLQLISADVSARRVAFSQPTKLAAMEGIFETQSQAALTAFGYVDMNTQQVKGLSFPGLLSFLIYRNFDTPVVGLNEYPREDWPPVQAVFQSYHMMIAMWGLMTLVVMLGLFFWKKGTLHKHKMLLRAMMISVTFPQIANQTGWMTAEMGRQPWIVWGVLRTSQGVSDGVTAGQVLGSIIMLSIIYVALFGVFLFVLDRKIKHGPDDPEAPEPENAITYTNPFTDKGGI